MIAMKSQSTITSFTTFLENFKNTLVRVFHDENDISSFSQSRGFPTDVLKQIMDQKPLSVSIPTEYGGRGAKVKECLGLLEASSYESLPLSLTFGINIALFLEPVAKYAQDAVKGTIFSRFLHEQNMGGLMITEPDYGSDALNMQTSNILQGDKYKINGTKHWQGLTGMADYWLMATRNKTESGRLSRDLDFFITDEQQRQQKIEVQEYYNNIGLYPIPYGKNKVNIEVPAQNKLQPESTGLKLMMDLLHRSRLQFPGMGMGFLRRMMDDAIKQCTERFVGGKPLMALDQVQFQVSKIQSAFTICSAMCSRSTEISSIENNVAGNALEANCMKSYVTDLMQMAAQTLTQLCGANGYKEESIAARGIVDSRPFQIFEGSNEMLYTQIFEMISKLMHRKKEMNLFSFLSTFNLTKNVANHFKSFINFELDTQLPQRKMIDIGKIISRMVSANYVLSLNNKGFRSDLVNQCIDNISHEIGVLASSYKLQTSISPIIDYRDGGNWLTVS